MATLASKDDLALYATKTELSTGLAPLASKNDLSTAVTPLATNAAFVAALAKNPAFLAALASQIAAGPNQFGISVKQPQTLTFPVIPVQTYVANKTLKLVAVTSSVKLTPITFTSSDPNVATVLGNVVTLKGKGTTTITATQAGNVSYNLATAVQVLTVK